MEKIKVVLIGAAHMHVLEQARYCTEHDDIALCGFGDARPEIDEFDHGEPYTRSWNVRYLRDTYALPCYDNYIEMLDSVEPDFAVITTETSLHAAVFSECAKRGISASIEKPMAMTMAEGEKLAAAAKANDVLLVVNWPIAWRPWFYQMKELLESSAIGTLVKMRYLAGHTGPLGVGAKHRGVSETAAPMTDEQRTGTWWYHHTPGGGALLDMLSYGAIVSRWMLGRSPEKLRCTVANTRHPYADIEDEAVAVLDFGTALAVIEGTWNSPSLAIAPGPELYGTEGMLRCRRDRDDVIVERMDYNGNVTAYPVLTPAPGMRNIVDAYAAYRNSGTPLPALVGLDLNLKALAVMTDCIAAAEKENTD